MSPIFGPRTGHRPLFDDLCQFHQLDKATRTLVTAVAMKLRPTRPADVFVDGVWLRKSLEDQEFAASREAIQEIYNSWFGSG